METEPDEIYPLTKDDRSIILRLLELECQRLNRESNKMKEIWEKVLHTVPVEVAK